MTGGFVNSDLFDDGLVDVSVTQDQITIDDEVRLFTVLQSNDPTLVDSVYEISYTVQLKKYPTISVTDYFTISFKTRGETEETNDAVEASIEDVDADESDDYVYVRPKIEPSWMKRLSDYRMVIGGDDLSVRMGKPISNYDDEMIVTVFFDNLGPEVAQFDRWTNSFHISQKKLGLRHVGYHGVKISASYEEVDGETIVYEKTIAVNIFKAA